MRNTHCRAFVIVAVWMVLVSATAVAAGPPAGPVERKRPSKTGLFVKKQHLVFDRDDVVHGQLEAPGGDVVTGNRKTTHSSLITVRKDFIAELAKSAEDS